MALSSTKPTAAQTAMPRLSSISRAAGELTTATATLTVPTPGESFVDITADVAAFVRAAAPAPACCSYSSATPRRRW